MSQFYCMTSTGVRPPHFKHSTINSAVMEATRLSQEHQCDVEILVVVGTVQWKEVPVTTRKQVIEMKAGYTDEDLQNI